MIYTLTLNPAIDLFIDTPTMRPNTVNRTNGDEILANGKGVNVSFVLNKMNVKTFALGVGGGFTMDYITSELTKTGIPNHFIDTGGITRINVFTHVEDQDNEYKLVNPGPEVDYTGLKKIEQEISKLTNVDMLIVSGSFSRGIDPSFIKRIADICQQNDVKLVIDTSYPSVVETLPFNPFLLKPNEDELRSWFKVDHPLSTDEIRKYAKELVNQGARNVLVSIGGDGALLVNQDQVIFGNAPKIKVLNTAGAGDTLLAVYIGSIENNMSESEALRYAIAAGSDTARSKGLTSLTNLEDLINQISVMEEKE